MRRPVGSRHDVAQGNRPGSSRQPCSLGIKDRGGREPTVEVSVPVVIDAAPENEADRNTGREQSEGFGPLPEASRTGVPQSRDEKLHGGRYTQST